MKSERETALKSDKQQQTPSEKQYLRGLETAWGRDHRGEGLGARYNRPPESRTLPLWPMARISREKNLEALESLDNGNAESRVSSYRPDKATGGGFSR